MAISPIFALDGVDEPGLLALDQWGQPDDSQNCGSGGGAVDAPDEPFLVADRNASSWSEGILGGGYQGCHYWGYLEG